MAWPQNYVLLGPDKRRPTYDQLDSIHWMSGCLKSVADLSEWDKPKYLTDLLQDAADFTFESPKACHAVVLTTMELDRLTWSDTLELDCLRRQHAQRHSLPTQHVKPTKNKNVNSAEKQDMPCKFYNYGYCSKQETHFTRGHEMQLH